MPAYRPASVDAETYAQSRDVICNVTKYRARFSPHGGFGHGARDVSTTCAVPGLTARQIQPRSPGRLTRSAGVTRISASGSASTCHVSGPAYDRIPTVCPTRIETGLGSAMSFTTTSAFFAITGSEAFAGSVCVPRDDDVLGEETGGVTGAVAGGGACAGAGVAATGGGGGGASEAFEHDATTRRPATITIARRQSPHAAREPIGSILSKAVSWGRRLV